MMHFLTYVSIYKSGTVSTTSTCTFPCCLRSTGKTELNESIVEAIVSTRRVSSSLFSNKCDHTGVHICLLHRDRAGALGRHVRGSRGLQHIKKHDFHHKKLGSEKLMYHHCLKQIFPIHIKGIAGSLVVLVNWLGAWAVSYTFNYMMSWSSTGNLIFQNQQTFF